MRQGQCPECGVHERICVCEFCRPIIGAPLIHVLQHPDEVGRAKGTLRAALACLPSMKVTVGEAPVDFCDLAQRAAAPGMALLFPSAGSRPLESSSLDLVKDWLVIDGTWRKARRIFLGNPWLQTLPRYHFQQPPQSQYRIRKAPRRDSLSTAEAIGYLIHRLQPQLDVTPLHDAMAALVERQLAVMPPEARRRY